MCCPKTQAVPGVRKLVALSGVGHTLEGNSNLTQTLGTSVPITVSQVNTADTLHVGVDLFGHDCLFLVDTGAAVSLISLDIWTQYASTAARLQPLTHQRVVSVNGSPLEVAGVTQVPLHIQGTTFEATVVIAKGLTAEGILGLNFLQQYGCTIDVERRFLSFGGTDLCVQLSIGKRHAPPVQDQSPLKLVAVVAQTIVIPPHCEQEILVRADFPVQSGEEAQTWLLEHDLPEKSRVIVARTVVSSRGPDEAVVIRVMNSGNEPSTLPTGMKVAQLQSLDVDAISVSTAVDELLSVNPSISESKRQLLWDMVLRADGLSDEERDALFAMLMSYEDVFATNSSDLGHTTIIQYSIHTGSALPIRQPPRRIPPHLREKTKELIDDMMKRGVIQKSTSPWSSPVVLVKKKDNSVRFCVDYRKINSITRRDAYPLPRVDDTLDTLGGSEWFTTLDLLSGYWQVQLNKDDQEKTAFATREGLFEFKVMPFGLMNGPATFQRLMDLVLAGLQWSHCLVYLDDVIILGKNFQKHLTNIQQVLQRMREAGLKVKPSKCELFRRVVCFLGHIISEKGIATDPAKTEKVASWPTPTNCRHVQQFLGFASYYRRFVQNFATIAKPLHRLTEKNSRFKWTEECQHAFDILREKLIYPPVLVFPDFSKEFILDTDASNSGIGAVLSQIQQDGSERVVAYASRVLTKAERKYSVTRKELLAVVVFISYFRQYLLGRSFLLHSDHGSLMWLRNFRNPEGQLARWLEKLQQFSFTIQHRPGKKHLNADALSRLPDIQAEPPITSPDTSNVVDVKEGSTQPCPSEPPVVSSCPPDILAVSVASGTLREMTSEELRTLQLQDAELRPIMTAKEEDKHPTKEEVSGESFKTHKLAQIWEQLLLCNGVLMRNYYDERRNASFKQIVVPRSLRQEILEELHAGSTGGHLGEEKTLERLKQRFYWPGHFHDVQDWCKTCGVCATRKMAVPKPRAPLTNISVGSPMQFVAVDIVGPFPENSEGKKYILVVVDQFTKWSEAYAIHNQEAVTVAEVLTREWFFRYSPPETLHSDQGRQFESRLIYEICHILGIKKTRTSPYHPQGDGSAERFNRTLLNMLAIAARNNPLNWENYVRPLCMAYNTSVHSSTGFTPFYLMFGREARLPLDLKFGSGDSTTLSSHDYVRRLQRALEYAYDTVRETLGNVQKRQKALYDKKVHGNPYKVGDQVWLHSSVVPKESHRKLHHLWSEPFVIVERLSDANYKIRRVGSDNSRTSVVHFDRLKFCSPSTRFPVIPPDSDHTTASQQTNVGDLAELVDLSDAEDHLNTDEEEAEAPMPPRYPQRQRRPPDRLHPFVSNY